jgi:catechol 2,3-dioxygenase-like lactoylglutathione lyase family enzyme
METETGRTSVSISGFDHLVLTVADLDETIAFYEDILGMHAITFGAGRRALEFGDNKINLHKAGSEFSPHAVPITSVYIRDPDGNLIEIASYDSI